MYRAAVILAVVFSSIVKADYYDSSSAAIEARIAPVGKVQIAKSDLYVLTFQAKDSSSATFNLGKSIFEAHCILCHGSGIAGAPIFANKMQWKTRIKKKLSTLFKHVKNGYHAMPPKGACLECSNHDLNVAINYILEPVK